MVAVLDKINNIKLKNLTGGGCCSLINYGSMNDVLYPFTYTFIPGNVYGIIGDCGMGGWALSYILAGKMNPNGGFLTINEEKDNSYELANHSFYVGADSGKKNILGKSFSVSKQIELGIKSGKSFLKDIDTIRKSFSLSEERFTRDFSYVSGERWKASMAIGFSMGKTIYCFPWVNTRWIVQHAEHLKVCLSTLINYGAIIVIPTSSKNIMNTIVKSYISVDLE